MNRLDLTELLETIALRATTLFGVSHCFIYLVEPGGEDIILKVGTGLYKDILSLRLKKGEGLSGKVWETGQTILIDNYGSWSGRYYGNDWEKPHAMVGIPLKSNSKVLGVIGLTSLEEGRSFSEDEIDLLQEFAQLAAIAVDNAELYTSTQRHLSELTTLQNVAKAINSTLKLNEFCRTEVEQMSNAFGYKMVSIYLISGNGLHLQAECGLGDIPTYCGLEFGVSGRVARTGIPAFLRDINADPDFVPLVSNTRQLIVMPLKAKEGQVIGTLGIGADREKVLTNEDFNLIGLLAEQVSIGISNANLFAKLSNSEEKYRYVVNNVNEIIFQTDSNGVLTFINSSWHDLSGYTIEESIGQPILKHVYPEDRKLILETFNKFREGALQEKSLEHRVVIRNDQIRWVYSFSSAIRDSNGYVTGVIGTVVDITERRKAEEERLLSERRMLESQRLESLGLLAGGIAHDFNNLLVSILGNSELALMEINKDAPLFDTIKQIEIASLRAADLTRQMLAYSGRGRFVMKTLDINEQAREIVQLLKSSISKRVSLEYKLTDSLPPIEADSGQIHQLIMNLVINAAEAIGDKDGKVIITSGIMYANCDYLSEANINPTATEGYFVYLEVEDNGTGMDADTVSRIFDPFFTTKFTGRGLGLSAVQGIVRGHNGALKIHSIVGNGTTFRVLFPASYNIFQPVNIIPQNNSTGSKNIRVLIIDDDDLLRKSTKRLLTQMGIEVFLASDGIEGLNTFLENHQDIDCILLDLTMPRLSGEETFHRLKEIDPDVRVIMMSGYSELEVSERFTGEYRVEFLQKPYTFQELKEKVVKAANSLYQ
jgi:PAS domain S-box-containing protein